MKKKLTIIIEGKDVTTLAKTLEFMALPGGIRDWTASVTIENIPDKENHNEPELSDHTGTAGYK